MADFDKILELEDKIQQYEEFLEKNQKTIAIWELELNKTKENLNQTEKRIEAIRSNIKFLKKEADVVILKSFQEFQSILRSYIIDRNGFSEKITHLEKSIKKGLKDRESTQSELEIAQQTLDEYGQVLFFKLNDRK